MDRRKSLKTLLVGTVSGATVLEACKNPGEEKKPETVPKPKEDAAANDDRMEEEIAYNKALREQTFFTPEEMATITVLADIIIPRDKVSGSASDARVPDFIEFIVKDKPEYQIPMRGGLRWLDVEALKRFETPFKNCSHHQQMEIVDDIAWPAKAKPTMAQGVAFFNLMRNLTATGFYTSQIGYKDVGYMGNQPNLWNGVPDDVLKQYGLSYSEKELKECISYDKV